MNDDDDSGRRINRHVGARVRARRKLMRRTQARLGHALGVTFQQIQKYERGTNQLSAAKLLALSAALDVPIGYFFDGLEPAALPDGAPDAGALAVRDLLGLPDGGDWARAILTLKSPAVRRKLLSLVEAMTRAD